MSLIAATMNNLGRSMARPSLRSPSAAWSKWMIGVLLAGHVWATCHALPLSAVWDYPVLAYDDFAVHAHRAYVFREAFRTSSDTWGCDPAVCGGTVMHPTQDVGSTIYEMAALLFPRVETGRLVTAVVWCAMLIAPLFLVWAGRLLEFDAEQIAWALLVACGMLWLTPAHRLMLYCGMVAFFLSSYICLFVLAVCDRFLRGPTALGYAGTILASSLLFFVHPFGPVAIAPGLLWLIARAPGVRWPWRLATLLTFLPVAALNAFWLMPVLAGLRSPPLPWLTALNLRLPCWTWENAGDFFSWVGPELRVGIAVLLVTSGMGLVGIARRRSTVTMVAIALTLLVSLLLFLLGSFWAPTRILQPVRFSVVFLNLSALLTGGALAGITRHLRFPWFISLAANALLGGAIVVAIAFSGLRLTPPPDAVDLVVFIQHHTLPGDRILLEAARPYPWLGEGLPAITHREIISTVFPDVFDPIQFYTWTLFGRSIERSAPQAQESIATWALSGRHIETLSADQAREVIARFSVNWVIVRNRQWHEFFRRLTGGPGVAVGPYEAFAVSREHSRFLVGAGEVRASVNRLELRNVSSPKNYVVLRYRYHPGWVCDGPATIEPFATPDNSGGLLLIRHPSPTTVLRFDPARALHVPWPVTAAPR